MHDSEEAKSSDKQCSYYDHGLEKGKAYYIPL